MCETMWSVGSPGERYGSGSSEELRSALQGCTGIMPWAVDVGSSWSPAKSYVTGASPFERRPSEVGVKRQRANLSWKGLRIAHPNS